MINIEIKYPSSTNPYVGQQYFSRSVVIQTVYKLLEEHPDRLAYFSSFDPSVCLLLKYSQNKYPVLFLNCGDGSGVMEDDVDNTQEVVKFWEKGV